ncbi:MAG TPA: DUF6474 family protein [Corynebacterium sp.]|nr:DUF6474 family protein [Corynebacterium sp.]
MGILSTILSQRTKARKEIKAAQSRARQEVKESWKKQARREKLLANLEKDLVKAEQKNLRNKRKHTEKQAKLEYDKLKAGRINPQRVRRWVGAARIAVPVLIPLIYRAITAGREQLVAAQAGQAGISSADLAQFSGHGGQLKARIEGVRATVRAADLPAGFARDAEDRLDELVTAVDNAEYMSPDQRRRALAAANRDLDKVAQEIQRKITR